jgi:uncharacterized membrane protein YkvA (DUF1232 family)
MSTSDNPEVNHRVGTWAQFVRQIRLVWRLLRDGRVSPWTKLLIPLTVAYLIFPLDFIPDFIPGLGQLDDLGIILLGLWLFVSLAPKAVVQEHVRHMNGAVDVTYRVVDEDPAVDASGKRRQGTPVLGTGNREGE